MAEIDGTELPVRLHDLLLAMAGRVDDDALSEIRELIAVAELDRAVDLLVGNLVAGRVEVTTRERVDISRMLDEVRSDPALANDLVVADSVPPVRHRFSGGSEPGGGLADVLRGVLDVLPDVLAVGSTWRVTPAGAAPGPLPQRVVLVEVGPGGYPPATAYRVEHVLRNAGVRAVVEVLRPGLERTEYHQQAAAAAQPVAFTGGPNGSAPYEPASRYASRHHRAEPEESEPAAEPDPDPVRDEQPLADPSAAGPAADIGAPDIGTLDVDAPDVGADIGSADIGASDTGTADTATTDLAGAELGAELGAVGVDVTSTSELDLPSVASLPPVPTRLEVTAALPHTPGPEETARHDLTAYGLTPEPLPVAAEQADEPASTAPDTAEDDSATAEEEPVVVEDAPEGDPRGERKPATAAPPLPPSVDGKLNDKERELLRQLHEELAQREQQRARRSSNNGAPPSNRWQVDRSGERQGGFSQTMPRVGIRSAVELVNGHTPPPHPHAR